MVQQVHHPEKSRRKGITGIRFHGRGGQGAVTSAELLALAAIEEGRYAQAMPSFGPERRGAPVLAFVRISDKTPIKVRAEVQSPDIVVVLDPTLLRIVPVSSGLKNKGIIVVNTKKSPEKIRHEFGIKSLAATVNATEIAKETLGRPITNTTMLGALVRATDIVNIESLIEPLKHRFGPLAQKNIQALERAYSECEVLQI
jgi:pyruvate ferredoxin oxidoreductase gamma subunit